MKKKQVKIFKYKQYPHFDEKIHWKCVVGKIENSEFIKSHAFYPFIRYCQVMQKYPKKYICGDSQKRDDPKTRTIMYSSHIDRYIYEYYAHLINTKYNNKVKEIGVNKCAVAYRTNLRKSNINFAKETFYFIRDCNDALVIIGDFTKYFDFIDHKCLKQQLCSLLGEQKLPDDYYAVFRSVTKFSYLELDEILKYKNMTKSEFNQLGRIFSPVELRNYKKGRILHNKNTYGIPQGSAISACLSNVYLLEFDKQLNDFATGCSGLYRRYCDDFIIVLPYSEMLNQANIQKVYSVIKSVPNLNLQPEKTQLYRYSSSIITSINEKYLPNVANGKNSISYLGFTFDGTRIRIRAKTITKFYQRMYKKIDNITCHNGISKSGKVIPKTHLFRLYSYKGQKGFYKNRSKRKVNGNFLDYVDRADRVFENKEAIKIDTQHAWEKLNYRFSHPKKKADK